MLKRSVFFDSALNMERTRNEKFHLQSSIYIYIYSTILIKGPVGRLVWSIKSIKVHNVKNIKGRMRLTIVNMGRLL